MHQSKNEINFILIYLLNRRITGLLKLRIIIFLLSSSFVSTAFSQAWKRQRAEVVGVVGMSSFLGDLGGSASEGGGYGPQDLDFSKSGFAIGGGYRYLLRSNMAVKGSLNFGMVYGDDAESQNPTRQARGLKFRSIILELSGQYEFYFLSERTKGMYRLRGAKGLKKLKLDGYLFVGLGVFFFNPQGEMDGKWHSLQPLGTEGQTSGNGSKYSLIQGATLFGLGFKKKVTRDISIGLEFGVRMTTTDYLDDVSGTYYHRDAIRDANGGNADVADYLSNPQDDAVWPSVTYGQDGSFTLQQRGDPSNNDTYFFSLITVNYKLTRKRRSLPKF